MHVNMCVCVCVGGGRGSAIAAVLHVATPLSHTNALLCCVEATDVVMGVDNGAVVFANAGGGDNGDRFADSTVVAASCKGVSR